MELRASEFYHNNPDLEDVLITKVEEVEDRIALHIEMDVKVHKCPSCGERTKKVHDYRIQKISI
ncbi:transposase [Bacillus thermophilus]|uniref:Transposase n=1 Tax=Siminovitchia thermophila TaxID=1245522 RepID=A0ABS2R692_9BACI|nr:transposase [Siminovitchia thermophila]ONK22749.1 hypothetical protein BLX87_13550 [Bacillus sp. VT-16-64]